MSKFETWNQTPYTKSLKDLQKIRRLVMFSGYEKTTFITMSLVNIMKLRSRIFLNLYYSISNLHIHIRFAVLFS